MGIVMPDLMALKEDATSNIQVPDSGSLSVEATQALFNSILATWPEARQTATKGEWEVLRVEMRINGKLSVASAFANSKTDTLRYSLAGEFAGSVEIPSGVEVPDPESYSDE